MDLEIWGKTLDCWILKEVNFLEFMDKPGYWSLQNYNLRLKTLELSCMIR